LQNLANYIQAKYGVQAARWQYEVGEKGQFVKLYNQMVQGLQSLPDGLNTYVIVAMHKQVAEDERRLQAILSLF
jgi:hypothetical protein